MLANTSSPFKVVLWAHHLAVTKWLCIPAGRAETGSLHCLLEKSQGAVAGTIDLCASQTRPTWSKTAGSANLGDFHLHLLLGGTVAMAHNSKDTPQLFITLLGPVRAFDQSTLYASFCTVMRASCAASFIYRLSGRCQLAQCEQVCTP